MSVMTVRCRETLHRALLFLRPTLSDVWHLFQVLFSIGITLVDVFLNWLNWFHFLFLEGGLLVILGDCIILVSPFLDVTRMSMSTVSFLAQPDPEIFCL